jgi:hypothetical protein
MSNTTTLSSQSFINRLNSTMTLVCQFHFSSEDLLHSDTYYAASLEVGDGDDVEYALEKADWEKTAGFGITTSS